MSGGGAYSNPVGTVPRLSALFDEIAEMEFERLPGMAECPARGAPDDGLSTILGLPGLTGLRELLATEPVVCNRRCSLLGRLYAIIVLNTNS